METMGIANVVELLEKESQSVGQSGQVDIYDINKINHDRQRIHIS